MDAIQQPGFNSILANASSNSFNDTTGCSTLLASITKSVDWLVFPDSLSFERCAFCLEQQVEAYNDLYEAQYPNASAEELDSLDEVNNFDTWGPLTQFEDDLNFNSLRVRADSIVDDWLESQLTNQLVGEYPDTFPVIRTAKRTLLNRNGGVIIGADTLEMKDWLEGEFWDDCGFITWEKKEFEEEDDPILENRRLVVRIQVMSAIHGSSLTGSIIHFHYNGSNWRRRRARLRLHISGGSFDNDCDLKPQIWTNFNSYKMRRSREITDVLWGLGWREAVVEPSNQWFTQEACVVDAFWRNDNYYFPVALVR
jgi:hypothetical protein